MRKRVILKKEKRRKNIFFFVFGKMILHNTLMYIIFAIHMNEFIITYGEDIDIADDNIDNIDMSYDYYIDNEIDMKPTYRSGIEKFLQGLTITLKSSKPIGFAGKVINGLPETIRAFFLPRKDKNNSNNSRGFGDFLNTFSDDFKAIFPGTLWCGDGNVANNPHDTGVFSDTDECCKQHDHCPFTISAGQHRDLLKNNGIFTRSACSCDYNFYNCLKKVNSLISENIGMTYFNILRPQCFGYHYPIESCEKYETLRQNENKCLQYKSDSTKNKTLEWYDLPDF